MNDAPGSSARARAAASDSSVTAAPGSGGLLCDSTERSEIAGATGLPSMLRIDARDAARVVHREASQRLAPPCAQLVHAPPFARAPVVDLRDDAGGARDAAEAGRAGTHVRDDESRERSLLGERIGRKLRLVRSVAAPCGRRPTLGGAGLVVDDDERVVRQTIDA